jgi:hypothetical protein
VASIRAPQDHDYPDGVLVYKLNGVSGIHDESIRCFDGNQTRFNVEITSIAGTVRLDGYEQNPSITHRANFSSAT